MPSTVVNLYLYNYINSKPINSKPINSKPINSKPINSKPINSKPINSKPINSKPINSKPINSKPINSKPINSKLVLWIKIYSLIPDKNRAFFSDLAQVVCMWVHRYFLYVPTFVPSCNRMTWDLFLFSTFRLTGRALNFRSRKEIILFGGHDVIFQFLSKKLMIKSIVILKYQHKHPQTICLNIYTL